MKERGLSKENTETRERWKLNAKSPEGEKPPRRRKKAVLIIHLCGIYKN
jgi:hypothetical protein